MENKVLMDYFRPLVEMVGDNNYLQALTAILFAFAVAKITSFIIVKIIGALASKTNSTLDDAIIRLLQYPIYWTVIQLGLLVALTLLRLPETPSNIIRNLIISILIVVWSIFVARIVRAILGALSGRAKAHSLIRPQTLPLFNNIVAVVVLVLATYLVFSAWNIDMTAWLASAGIIGIAVGFAAKDTLANLFSGVFILADSPYKIGDYVVLEGGERGKVTHIGIRSTRILTRDDVEVTIPNAIIGNTRVTNESGGPHEKYRIRVPVGVAYGSDVDQVKAVLLQVAHDEQQVCDDPEPRVRFRNFGNSSLDFELLCWVYNPEFRGRVLDVLNTNIYKSFMSHGNEIPYSKHDVFIKEMPAQTESKIKGYE